MHDVVQLVRLVLRDVVEERGQFGFARLAGQVAGVAGDVGGAVVGVRGSQARDGLVDLGLRAA